MINFKYMNMANIYESPEVDVLEIISEHSILLTNSVSDWEDGDEFDIPC